MKLGFIGLPQSGKKTILKTLLKIKEKKDIDIHVHNEPFVATVTVYDKRLDLIAKLFSSSKTVYPKIEYMIPAENYSVWNQIRICDGLIHVIRNFELAGEGPTPEEDFWKIEEEMILTDLMTVEKRIEKINADMKKGKKGKDIEKEMELLKRCKEMLDQGIPLREDKRLSSEPLLKGFTFLSAKPLLVIVNNEEDNEDMPDWKRSPKSKVICIRAKLEQEISEMDENEKEEFMKLYNIKEYMTEKIPQLSLEIMNKTLFFTANEKEARAWIIEKGTKAICAAGHVHSDMKKGFISAEVISFEDLKKVSSISEARKKGLLRIEGKDYIVRDGDLLTFRFNI